MQRGWRTIAAVLAMTIGIAGVAPRAQLARALQVRAAGLTLVAWDGRVTSLLADGSLDLGAIQPDTLIPGRSHERLDQRYEGLPVFGGQLVRQRDGRTPVSVFGRFFEGLSLPTTTPSLTAADAGAAAERAAGAGAAAGPLTLGILPDVGTGVLVYRTRVRSAWDVRTYFVNARTGAVEKQVSALRRQNAPVVGKGAGVLKDDKKVSATRSNGAYQAVDLLRPAAGFTLDFAGSLFRLNEFMQTGLVFLSDVAVSTNNTWTDGAVVDAHVYQGWVYDYYFKRLGRRGLDDRNLEVLSIVHPLARKDALLYPPELVGLWINNAAYLHPGIMIYGDGDGRVFDFLSGALDVIGHELTHGITEFTSQLDYQDEPGALNEAFSDIMGTAIEFFHLKPGGGPQRGPNFLIGEDVQRQAPGFTRSMQEPMAAGDPDHYSLRQFIGTAIDNGGVHVNSTIVSHAFYLAVNGGRNRVSGLTVTGVGVGNIERMERIFYRAFAFMLVPLSQFSDARAATLQAAADLYGANSQERAQLAQAWTAVGVF